jgi:thymidylate synthase (FAD)
MIEVTYLDHCGSDLTTVNAARVSFGKQSGWASVCTNCGEGPFGCDCELVWNGVEFTQSIWEVRLSEADTKLIHYLAKHKHMSPFGHAFASFHVKAPIFVARQLVKHKFLRWNEISRRYVDDEPEFYKPEVWRNKSEDKKQGSEGEHPMQHEVLWPDGVQNVDMREWAFEVEGDVLYLYNTMIKAGVAPEQARMVLPQSTMTEWYWSGSLDAFADMAKLRLKEDTQYETRLVAQQIDKVMSGLFPVSWKALVDVE